MFGKQVWTRDRYICFATIGYHRFKNRTDCGHRELHFPACSLARDRLHSTSAAERTVYFSSFAAMLSVFVVVTLCISRMSASDNKGELILNMNDTGN